MSASLENVITLSSGDGQGVTDPKSLGYKTNIFPEIMAVLLVKDVENYHHIARNMDRRLRRRLESRGKSFDYSLNAFSSIRGQMLDKLTTTTSKAEYRMENRGKPDKGLISMLGNKDG